MPWNDRLAWVRDAIGYDERDPGALYPHLILPDGSLQDDGLWWQAGEESAVLDGMYAACELEGFAAHMFAVNAAIDAAVRTRASHAFPAHARTRRPASLRERLALWLLNGAVRAMPRGQEANMLGHLAKYWRNRWFA